MTRKKAARAMLFIAAGVALVLGGLLVYVFLFDTASLPCDSVVCDLSCWVTQRRPSDKCMYGECFCLY
ncbi:hypothetical protein [Corallococcus carmarthensis]|uniref:Uncharacterized protein n=1 Tax=Corallococcus carmarthensis TaxID=2316728 RepID=A0A3A8KES4_9BACT|nr:hypothetical protein [Corallococcus carmarthensis]NOK17252.1 hypothetical protein [Corallococcus carmarthensis]RKH05807.1 hypothetical protein D7X32_06860 [Corallococcus carmarthensis]